MVLELCTCDWGLGAPLPPHQHRSFVVLAWLDAEDHPERKGKTFEMSLYNWDLNKGSSTHLIEVARFEDEVYLHINWRRVARLLLWGERESSPPAEQEK